MSEHELQNATIGLLKAMGLYALRVNSGKVQNLLTGTWLQLCPSGTPDILCSRPDRTMGFIEIKSKTGTLNSDQITQLRDIDRKGLAWLVADDLDDVDRWLKDPAYHGKTKHTDKIKNSFAYSKIPNKSRPITGDMMMEWELWQRKKNSEGELSEKATSEGSSVVQNEWQKQAKSQK